MYFTPTIVINEGVGNCIDIAHLIRQYCLHKRIPNAIGQCAYEYRSNPNDNTLSSASHIVCVVRQQGKWSVTQTDGIGDPLTHITSCIAFPSHSPLYSLQLFHKSYINGLKHWIQEWKLQAVPVCAYVRLLPDYAARRLDSYYESLSDSKQEDFHLLVTDIPKVAVN